MSDFVGLSIFDVVAVEDHPLLRHVLQTARDVGCIENIVVRAYDENCSPRPLALAGHYLGESYQHYYLALNTRVAGAAFGATAANRRSEDGLHEADGFAELARQRFGAARRADMMDSPDPAEPKLTLLSVPQLDTLGERLDEPRQHNLRAVLAAMLRSYSADKDSAARLADDRYGLVHDEAANIDELKQRLHDLLGALDPSGPDGAIQSATLATGGALSDEDMAKGLLYAINDFQRTSRVDLTLSSLGDNLDRLARKGAGYVSGFKHIVKKAQFDIAFHPIIGTTDGRIHHYEVLARFQGRYGDSPYQYITFAEETGLILDFDLAMTEKVIAWMAQSGGPELRLAVNLSGKSVTSADFGEQLNHLLRQHRWTQGRLLFEITESFQIDDLDNANRLIQGLRERGYAVCLDDFGAGAASFQYLNMIDVDIVKFDGSAIRNSQSAAKGPAFLKALTTLCHEVGVDCVAEMVDSPQTLAFVRACGIGYAQGYLFGKPSKDLSAFAVPEEMPEQTAPAGASPHADRTAKPRARQASGRTDAACH
jgi:EAL domain-containing protein (putative c-di-GMP-specific phosphodiesterase class I)